MVNPSSVKLSFLNNKIKNLINVVLFTFVLFLINACGSSSSSSNSSVSNKLPESSSSSSSVASSADSSSSDSSISSSSSSSNESSSSSESSVSSSSSSSADGDVGNLITSFDRLEAETSDVDHDIVLNDDATYVNSFGDGSYLVFEDFDFGISGAKSIAFYLAKAESGGDISVRLNAIDGPTICEFSPTITGGNDSFELQHASCEPADGVNDIYIVGSGVDQIAALDYFQFSRKDVSGRPLCVFDYDLTLSSNKCSFTHEKSRYFCRTTVTYTYNWNYQCQGINAQEAVARCVEENAYIAIASHAPLAGSYDDKVLPIVTENQFPAWLSSVHYNNPLSPINYPAVDDRDNWNCDTCPYQMDPNIDKSEGVSRAMRHYGLDPESAEDRARVIFWDDSTTNISNVNAMQDVHAIHVPRNRTSGDDGGCGISHAEIEAGWLSLQGED